MRHRRREGCRFCKAKWSAVPTRQPSSVAACRQSGATSHSRTQKRFHSRYNFGYGILLYIRETPYFRPKTAHFGGSRGIFPYKTDKSAILCPGKTEVADFVSFKGSIVQGINLQKILFVVEKCDIILVIETSIVVLLMRWVMGIIGSILKHTVGKAIEHTVGYAAADAGIKACDAASKK